MIAVRDRAFALILILVLSLHVSAFFAIQYLCTIKPLISIPKKLTVSTVKLSPRPQATAPAAPAAAARPEPVPALSAVKLNPTPSKVEKVKQKPAPIKKTAVKPLEDSIKKKQKALLSQVKDKISKVNKSEMARASTSASGAMTPAMPGALQIEAPGSWDFLESAYQEDLAGRLKLLLRLPEYGEVKLSLTLSRSGAVQQVKIISAKSAANRTYVTQTLPSHKMPAFGDNFGNVEKYTFIITLVSP
jgi:outer membrane biosynthesis protein TonB